MRGASPASRLAMISAKAFKGRRRYTSVRLSQQTHYHTTTIYAPEDFSSNRKPTRPTEPLTNQSLSHRYRPRLRPLAAPALDLDQRRARIPRTARPVPQEAKGPPQGPHRRRELHLDRAPFPPRQGQAHHPGFRLRGRPAPAELRGYIRRRLAAVSRVLVPPCFEGRKGKYGLGLFC